MSAALVQSLLQQQRDNLVALLELLTKEKQVLGKNEPATLEAIVDEKNHCLQKLQDNDNQLAHTDDVKSILAHADIQPLKHEVEQLMAEARKLNDINGAIIQRSQITVNRIRTTILEGQGKSSLTYDDKAKTSTGVNTLNIKA